MNDGFIVGPCAAGHGDVFWTPQDLTLVKNSGGDHVLSGDCPECGARTPYDVEPHEVAEVLATGVRFIDLTPPPLNITDLLNLQADLRWNNPAFVTYLQDVPP